MDTGYRDTDIQEYRDTVIHGDNETGVHDYNEFLNVRKQG